MLSHRSLYRLSVTADSDSVFLARVTDALACLNLIPECLYARRDADGAGEALFAILVVSATASQVDILTRKFLRMTLVHGVEVENSVESSRNKQPSHSE
jgi:hypothetical protein